MAAQIGSELGWTGLAIKGIPPLPCCPALPPLPTLAAYISSCAGIALLLVALLQPFMPSFCSNLLAQLGGTEVGTPL